MSEHPKINPDADIVARLESEPLSIHLAGEAAEEIRRLRAALRELVAAEDEWECEPKDDERIRSALEAARKTLEPKP